MKDGFAQIHGYAVRGDTGICWDVQGCTGVVWIVGICVRWFLAKGCVILKEEAKLFCPRSTMAPRYEQFSLTTSSTVQQT